MCMLRSSWLLFSELFGLSCTHFDFSQALMMYTLKVLIGLQEETALTTTLCCCTARLSSFCSSDFSSFQPCSIRQALSLIQYTDFSFQVFPIYNWGRERKEAMMIIICTMCLSTGNSWNDAFTGTTSQCNMCFICLFLYKFLSSVHFSLLWWCCFLAFLPVLIEM